MRGSRRKGSLVTVIIQKRGKKIVAKAPLSHIDRMVFVINHQFTNAPNTTQISSGAGRSSASGSNGTINSPDTDQQGTVGAGGIANNRLANGKRTRKLGFSSEVRSSSPYFPHGFRRRGRELVIVINEQIAKLPRGQQASSATQIASGAGKYSLGGTNAAIDSPRTRQQQAVGGGSGARASNVWRSSGSTRKQRRRR